MRVYEEPVEMCARALPRLITPLDDPFEEEPVRLRVDPFEVAPPIVDPEPPYEGVVTVARWVETGPVAFVGGSVLAVPA